MRKKYKKQNVISMIIYYKSECLGFRMSLLNTSYLLNLSLRDVSLLIFFLFMPLFFVSNSN